MGLEKRNKKRSYMNTGTSQAPVYNRMTGFNALDENKNAVEYTRTYVDSEIEESDVTGYAPSVDYDMDYHSGNVVHEKIKEITDDEKTGEDTIVDIVTVDLSTPSPYVARKRIWAIIPGNDNNGVGTDSSKYTGSFKAKSTIVKGTATVSSDGSVATFTPDEEV